MKTSHRFIACHDHIDLGNELDCQLGEPYLTTMRDGSVRFHVYLDGGTPEAPVHVVAADLLDANNRPVAHYDAAALATLPKTAFVNDYAYNKFAPGPFGIRAPMGAAATVTLPISDSGATPQARSIRLTDVDGRTFSATLESNP